MLLIGYDGRTKDAYRMWNPKTRRVIISRDVRFLEKRTWHRRLVPASWEATHRLGEPLQARPELVDDHAQRGDGLADLAHQSARRGDVIVNPESDPIVAESDPIVAEKPEIRDVEPDELEEMGDLGQQGHVQAGGDESYDGPSGAGDVQMDGQPRASNPEHDHMDADGMDANPAPGPAAPQPSDADVELMPIDEGEMALDRRAPPPPPPRCSGRERLIPRHLYEDHLFDVRAVQEAREGPECEGWIEAMDKEHQAMHDLGVFEYVLREEADGRVIQAKWVFKQKPDRKKAWLVAKGFQQRLGPDEETYAPTMSGQAVRTFMAAVLKKGWSMRQLDVNTAFLNAPLDTPVYMECPEGYEKPGHVIRLRKALYGLREAPRAWNQLLVQSLRAMGFEPLDADPCIFTHKTRQLWLGVVVDDIVYAGCDADLDWFLEEIGQRFAIKDLGEVDTFVGIKVKYDKEKGEMTLSQEKYISSLLTKFRMERANPAMTPLPPGVRLSSEMGPRTEAEAEAARELPYRELVGSLLYSAITVRPDIAYACKELTKFFSCWGKTHFRYACHVLRYLKGTAGRGLVFKRKATDDVLNCPHCGVRHEEPPEGKHIIMAGTRRIDLHKPHRIHICHECGNHWDEGRPTLGRIPGHEDDENTAALVAYADASWADQENAKSTGGFVIQMDGCPIAWSSRTQSIVALSSTEYIAASDCTRELLYLMQLMEGLGFKVPPTVLYGDNDGCIQNIKNHQASKKTRHVAIKYHHVRSTYQDGKIRPEYVPSKENVADLLTKSLPASQHAKLTCMVTRGADAITLSNDGLTTEPERQKRKRQTSKSDMTKRRKVD
ncbi:unnamed protein product [Vitrella brassicaformis CCMP3155]|uniref:Uncharacterized protein n=1 Tax=Vitrella brassicaformis (strain CCMP3155) TaxID=1169540 RepID=A0A0G4GZP2_VITBC|nr:unnamed protein product [Vitrella brassicaformis CCMP3155]|eukprot:CEM36698.1 unnamed protein product [Vitrella brassicaformis CCMP3155]